MTLEQYKQKITPDYHGYQELHIHTTGSYRDGANTVQDVFDSAEKLGRNAVSITDHGNFTRLFAALKERTKREKKVLNNVAADRIPEQDIDEICHILGDFGSLRDPQPELIPYIEKYGDILAETASKSIQFIPGIEMYATDGPNDNKARHHIIFYAVDWEGAKQLFKLCNLAQLNSYADAPQVTFETLERFVGPNTKGHGKVIATSACVGGHLSQILLRPQKLRKKIDELTVKLHDCSTVDDETLATVQEQIMQRQEKLSELKRTRSELKALGKKKFSSKIERKQNKIVSLQNTLAGVDAKRITDERKTEQKQSLKYDIAKAESELAELQSELQNAQVRLQQLPDIEKQIAEYTDAIAAAKTSFGALEKEARPRLRIQAKIKELEEQLNALTDVYALAKETALHYERIFGKGNYYIELQNHGIPDELYCLPLLKQIAEETGIPLTIANDVHYPVKEARHLRDLLYSMRFNESITKIENEIGSEELYFKSNEEMESLFSDLPQAIQNTSEIAKRCNVFYKKEMHLPQFDTGCDLSDGEYLEQYARGNIKTKYPDYDLQSQEWKDNFEKRLAYEIKTIDEMGYNSYLDIVQDFIFYARKKGGPTCVGPGRGSAAGSLVCYLLDITNVDPLKYDLLFERFLNPERVSMPDIDTDFSNAVRQDVIDYVAQRYAYKGDYDEELKTTVCSIHTEGTLAGRGAVRAVGRVTDVALEICDKVAKMIPMKLGITIREALEENPDLNDAYEKVDVIHQLLDDAMLVEGFPDHHGVHAAGIIIADKPITEYAPMFWNAKKGLWVIQYEKDSCENDIGVLKMDFLGLKNLDIITTTNQLSVENGLPEPDFQVINRAEDKAVFSDIYAKANSNGVFQFESDGMKQMLLSLRPQNIEDVVLLNAAYRPGPMQYIPDIIKVKQGKKKPDYLIPEMETIFGNTYGKPIYQEQIMLLFNKIAGFSLGTADIIRRAMSKKKMSEMMKYKDSFIQALIDKGADKNKVEEFWDELMEFAKYAFNKSHAVVYSIISYETAYLKEYYPTVYMTALLRYADSDKFPLYIRNAKQMGISVSRPDVNHSQKTFSIVNEHNIIFGLGDVKNVSNGADVLIQERETYGPFQSLKDLVMRGCLAGFSPSVLSHLINAGAFDDLIKNRKMYAEGIKDYFNSCKALLKKIKARTSSENDTRDDLLLKLQLEWEEPSIPRISNYTQKEALKLEKELLGCYVSGHPLDEYASVISENAKESIASLSADKNTSICGQIRDIEYLNRKSDGRPFCKFTLEDLTGSIDVLCFSKAFAEYKDLIKEDSIVVLEGHTNVEYAEDEETMISKDFVAQKVLPLNIRKEMLIFCNLAVYTDIIQPALEEQPRGNIRVNIFDSFCNEMRKTRYQIVLSEQMKQLLDDMDIRYVI